MHAHGDAQDRAKADQVCADMAVADRAVVGAPVVHHVICGLERASLLAVASGCKPGAGPGVVGSLPQGVRNVSRQIQRPALCNLQYRTKTLDQIESDHGNGHFCLGFKAGGITAATEIAQIGIVPGGVFHNGLGVLLGDLIPGLERGIAICILSRAVCIQTACAGVDQMDKAVCLGSLALEVIARAALDSITAPIGTDVGKHLCAIGQQLHKQHADAVEHVVLGGQNIGLSRAVPVKRGVEHSLGKVAVGIEVRPLTLTLKSCGDGVMTNGFFLVTLRQVGVTVHQILDDHGHLDHEFPVCVLLLARSLQGGIILVKALDAILLCPSHCLVKFVLIVNLLGHATDDLDLVHGLHSHAKVILDEIGADDRATNAHADRADLQIGLASHGCGSNCSTAKTEQLFPHVLGDRGVVAVLYIMTVNTECGQTLLRVGSQHGCKIHRSGTLGAVKAPYGLDGVVFHIHGFCTVAPARSYGQRDGHALTSEFFGTSGGLCHAAYGGVCDDNLDGCAVGIAKVFFEKLCGTLGHVHGLILKGFSDLQNTSSAVDGGSDADYGIAAYVSVCHGEIPFLFSLCNNLQNFTVFIISNKPLSVNQKSKSYDLLFLRLMRK